MKRIENVSIVGAGIMGSGIAKTVLKQGFKVKLYDSDRARTEAARESIIKSTRRVDPANLIGCSSLEEVSRGADLIIEAVIEDLEVKCELFGRLGELAGSETIFASNTSSLSIGRMAHASSRPDRFVGLHFFNPAFLMRLVEFVVPPTLDESVLKLLEQFLLDIKKSGIKCKESPGFIVNRILIPMVNEALYTLEESGISDEDGLISLANEIDSAIVKENILLIGAYDLLDLTGLDTINRVAQVIYEGFGQSERYRPPAILKSYLERGKVGRKGGKGLYYYGNNLNDPDNNPPLDSKGNRIVRVSSSLYDTTLLVAVIVNEAFRVLEEGIAASYRDIEECMELGTRWPKGPFALAKERGLNTLFEALKESYNRRGNDPRYKPSQLFLSMPEELENYFSQS